MIFRQGIKIMIYSILFLMFVVSGFVLSVQASDDPTIEFRVAKKDSLIKISERILENPARWREVAKINRLKDPYIIQPDQVLLIPLRLISGTPMDGVVTFSKGDTKIQRKDGDEWLVLRVKDKVSQGNNIKTGKASILEITFEDKSILFMRQNTLLSITTSQKKGIFAIVSNINLKTGKAISNIKSATGTETRYEINTPSAVASARGTEFRVSLDDNITTRAEVVEGKVMIMAQNKSVEVKSGEGTVVEKGEPPAQPSRLLAPPKLIDRKTIYKDIPLQFRFDAPEGTSTIRAMLTRDADGKDILFESLIKPRESFSIANIDDGSYYLVSHGIDARGLEGLRSETILIKFRANPLPPFIQIKDEDAEFIGKSAEFKWLKVKDAVHYHVQIAKDKEFKQIVEHGKDFKADTYKTGTHDYGQYYFRVCSVASDGYEGGWSNVIAFRLIPPPPSPPLEKPAVDKNSIFLKWRNLGEGITYHFQMAKDEAFKEILVDEKLNKSEITLKKPKDPGTYYVRTSSIDKKGREGNFSLPQSFEVERGFPYKTIGVLIGLGILGLLFL